MLVLRLTTIFTVFSLALATPYRIVSHDQLFPLPGHRHRTTTASAASLGLARQTEPLPLPLPGRRHRFDAPPPSSSSSSPSSSPRFPLTKRSPAPDLGLNDLFGELWRYVNTARGRIVGAIAVSASAMVVAPLGGGFLFVTIVGVLFAFNAFVMLWLFDLNDLLPPPIPGLPPKEGVQSFSRQQQHAALRMMRNFAARTGRTFRQASAAEKAELLQAARAHGKPLTANVA